jgi:hypothetical protein
MNSEKRHAVENRRFIYGDPVETQNSRDANVSQTFSRIKQELMLGIQSKTGLNYQ